MKLRNLYPVVLSLWAVNAYSASIVDLQSASYFAVLAGTTVTNTGVTVVDGELGVSPGTAVTGFGVGTGVVINGTIHTNDALAIQAQSDLSFAYSAAAGETCGTNLTGQDLGGLTLTPGVYCFDSSAQLTGTLILDSLGDPNAGFLFQIGSTLTTASNSSVLFINGGVGDNLFFQVGSSATLGTSTDFAGHILALTSITLNTDATIGCGSALASNGAVTLDTNTISINSTGCDTGGGEVPEPSSASLVLLVGAPGLWLFRRFKASRNS